MMLLNFNIFLRFMNVLVNLVLAKRKLSKFVAYRSSLTALCREKFINTTELSSTFHLMFI